MATSKSLREMLIRHEGLRLRPYDDATGKQHRTGVPIRGKLTIGVGRNLDDVGITRAEALTLLDHDIAKVRRDVNRALLWFRGLNRVRQNVVLNMVFNLGLPRFRTFKNTVAAIKEKRWDDAANEMLNSRWERQVKGRARELARMMRRGT